MRHCFLAALIALTSPTLLGATTISGTVVDENGLPVPHMTIEICPTDMAWSGGIPQAITDDHGHFVKEVVGPVTSGGRVYGQRWAVYPHQEKENYYPDLSSKFYATTFNHAQHVQMTVEAPETTVIVKLGPKAGALVGKVTDALTGQPIKPYFEFAWASDPANRMGEGTSENYRILLPSNTDIKMTVSSEGYKTWSYPGTISIGPGQDMTLDIKLEPEPK